jgi:hypothetical protein
MARSNFPRPDPATALFAIVSITLKVFAWFVASFLLMGLMAAILGLLPLYQVVEPIVFGFLWRFAAIIVCFIGFVAISTSIR